MTPIAISIKANLESVMGSKHIYPVTFANVGHNLVGQDHKAHTAKAVQVDSVGSFANRIEQELAAMGILPEITTQVGDRLLSIHELPHRAYDAILRDSLLDGIPWRNSAIGQAVLGSTPDNATALYTYAPLTLLLGGWDSHGGDAGRGASIARSVACEIWGYEVLTTRQCSETTDGITCQSEGRTRVSVLPPVRQDVPRGCPHVRLPAMPRQSGRCRSGRGELCGHRSGGSGGLARGTGATASAPHLPTGGGQTGVDTQAERQLR